jgi:hypothetical protein
LTGLHATLGWHCIQRARFHRRLLRMTCTERAQVIGRLETALPRLFVGLIELLAGCSGEIEIERLRLIDPFLAARRGFDQE